MSDLLAAENRHLRALLKRAAAVMKTPADMVFNDNGDITVSGDLDEYEVAKDCYFVRRAILNILEESTP